MITIWYCIAFFIITFVCSIVMVIVFLLTALFDSKRVVVHLFSRVWSALIFLIHPGWRRQIEGLENIDRNKAYVIVTNHQSVFDIPHMYALPLFFKWVSKREIYNLPAFGLILRMHRDIVIDRMSAGGTKKFLNKGILWLNKGVSVMIFPEGTRSKNGQIKKFKEGAFLLAQSGGVGILPVVAQGMGRATYGKKVRRHNLFTIKVLPPISAEEVAQTDTKELAASVEAMVRREYDLINDRNK